ncbi:MAG: hypothetical protein A2Y73_07200 [Chloroflexi bacterium RBG_13_56_8]|nr:MAG: hypothetical protein A2Y73_07200 [Chloroflexi bacterium RBG_13_56_8]
MIQENEKDVRGFEAAVERYGCPLIRCYTFQTDKTIFDEGKAGLAQRTHEVVVLLRRLNGRYLVHTKSFYPEGVYRLLSGGIKPGEDLLAALRREVREETSLRIGIERFLGVLRYRFIEPTLHRAFTSYLFSVAETGGVLKRNDPHEEISDYREMALHDLTSVAEQLESLPEAWATWGRFRAAAHRLAVEVLTKTYEQE